MDRNEVEREIAKYLVKIRDLYHEYNPDGRYLSATIWYDRRNGNDNGEWSMWGITCSNAYYKEDNARPINLDADRDVKDEKYWACITPEEDVQMAESWKEEAGEDYLDDGTFIIHRSVERMRHCKSCANFQRLAPNICRCELMDLTTGEYDEACENYEVTAV